MKLGERLSAVDRFQRTFGFKVGASAVVVILFLVYTGFAVVGSTTGPAQLAEARPEIAQSAQGQEADSGPSTITNESGQTIDNVAQRRQDRINEILKVSQSPVAGIIGAAAVAGVALVVVWVGLGLTYTAALVLAATVGFPLYRLGGPMVSAIGFMTMGMTALLLCLSVLIRGVSMALNTSHPVTSIARNVLAEAIRMKVSLVLMLGLAFMLASMPLVLDGEQPLRYRVQAFLQWSSGLSFWLVALLVVFFSVATVTYEQREKVIWQTMTKPVAAWQYLLGKWLGVVLLGTILMTVSGIGVYQFTEFLRSQAASGEVAPYRPVNEGTLITEDRLILETQVLTARKNVRPTLPFGPNDPQFDDAVERELSLEAEQQTGFNPTAADVARIRSRLFQDTIADYRSIDPRVEQYEVFTFYGLQDAKEVGTPLTLRYKINSGGNRPDEFFFLTFEFEDGTVVPPRKTGLGFSHTMTLDPSFINNDGTLSIAIHNGALMPDERGQRNINLNPGTATIPPDGLELSYSVGSYTGNFARIMGVMCVKLALLAMVSIFAGTFASFPVASLIAMTAFFIAEGSRFVQDALTSWDRTNDSKSIELVRNLIYHFADLVSQVLVVYSDLRPTGKLAQGIVLSWGEVSQGVLALGAATAVFYLLGVLIFRSRQLAIYSGH